MPRKPRTRRWKPAPKRRRRRLPRPKQEQWRNRPTVLDYDGLGPRNSEALAHLLEVVAAAAHLFVEPRTGGVLPIGYLRHVFQLDGEGAVEPHFVEGLEQRAPIDLSHSRAPVR